MRPLIPVSDELVADVRNAHGITSDSPAVLRALEAAARARAEPNPRVRHSAPRLSIVPPLRPCTDNAKMRAANDFPD